MTLPRSISHRVRLAAVILVAALALAACGSQTPENVPDSVTLTTAEAPFGTYLTDASGRALYMWDMDRSGSSKCYGDCAVDWPPLVVNGTALAGTGVDADLIGQVKRRGGAMQVTYGGWPLYYFEPDQQPGQLTGQGDPGFGAVWWVVSPDGKPLPSS